MLFILISVLQFNAFVSMISFMPKYLNTENNSKTYTMSQINTFTCELQKDVKGASQVHTAPESKEQSMGS